MTQDGRLTGKPMQLVRRALRLNPDHTKALALAGTEAFSRADYRAAVKFWDRAIHTASQQTEFTDSLLASLDEAKSLVAGKVNGSVARTSEVPGAAASAVAGKVFLASSLAARTSPGDTLFIYARAQSGRGMPLAILTAKARDLPMNFVLDDSLSMSQNAKLSSVKHVFLTARVSKTGSAAPRPGDLLGNVGPVRLGTNNIKIEIREIAQ
jgi:cytochrome c-type biogenesis protein CcmH